MTISMISPAFVLELSKLRDNLTKINYIQEQTGVIILHTLKSFHFIEGLEIINEYVDGYSMVNLNEYEHIEDLQTRYIHSYAPYIYPKNIESLAKASHSMSFNSLNQWDELSAMASKYCSVGLRINPQLSIKQPKYCDANIGTRLGVLADDFWHAYSKGELDRLDGIHFHVLCSGGVDELRYLLSHIEKEYTTILPKLKWLNLGGGHSFGQKDYDVDEFCHIVNLFQTKNPNIKLIFEPGEGLLVDSGYFRTTILDIIKTNDTSVAILDTSIEAHLLDIAITKQKPKIKSSSKSGKYNYIISGMSCIAGDIIGEYSFEKPLKIGEQIIFKDMIAYTTVKQTEYNGIANASFLIC